MARSRSAWAGSAQKSFTMAWSRGRSARSPWPPNPLAVPDEEITEPKAGIQLVGQPVREVGPWDEFETHGVTALGPEILGELDPRIGRVLHRTELTL